MVLGMWDTSWARAVPFFYFVAPVMQRALGGCGIEFWGGFAWVYRKARETGRRSETPCLYLGHPYRVVDALCFMLRRLGQATQLASWLTALFFGFIRNLTPPSKVVLTGFASWLCDGSAALCMPQPAMMVGLGL